MLMSGAKKAIIEDEESPHKTLKFAGGLYLRKQAHASYQIPDVCRFLYKGSCLWAYHNHLQKDPVDIR